MSRKQNRIKRLRKKASLARKDETFAIMKGKSILEETYKQLHETRASLAESKREVSRLTKLASESKNLEAFRVHVSRSMPFRNGEIYQVNVAFDCRALEYGFSGLRDGVFNLSSRIRHITEELRYKIERSIVEELTNDGVLNKYAI